MLVSQAVNQAFCFVPGSRSSFENGAECDPPSQGGFAGGPPSPLSAAEDRSAIAALCRVEPAAFATRRARLLDVFVAGNRRLRRHQPATGIVHPAQLIRQRDPFDRVPSNGEVPKVHDFRVQAEHQRVQAGDHQARDVVGLALVQGCGGHPNKTSPRTNSWPCLCTKSSPARKPRRACRAGAI